MTGWGGLRPPSGDLVLSGAPDFRSRRRKSGAPGISTNVTDRKNDVFRRFLQFFGILRGSDPNVMGTSETGSLIRFRKALYHFCSSNGLVSAAD